MSGYGKCLNQVRVDEEFLASRLHLAQEADVDELLQIDRCRLALGNVGVDDVGDAATGLYEDQLGQLARVDAGRVALHPFGCVVDERSDGLDPGRRPLRGTADRVEHEQYPRLPGGIPADIQQEAVVVLPGFDDGFGQVEHRDVELQAFRMARDSTSA